MGKKNTLPNKYMRGTLPIAVFFSQHSTLKLAVLLQIHSPLITPEMFQLINAEHSLLVSLRRVVKCH